MAFSLALLGASTYEKPALGSYDLLSTTILTTNTASVTFASLGTYAADYQHLQLRMTQRSSDSNTATQSVLELNGDTNVNNYAMHLLLGNGSSVISDATVSGSLGGFAPMGRHPAANATANTFGAIVVDILDAFSTVKNTTVRALDGQASSENRIELVSGVYLSLSEVSSLRLRVQPGSNYVTGSRFSLYGLRKV
jgi:hypothetical protein